MAEGLEQQPLIRIRGLTKTFETPAGPFRALRGIDLDLKSGEFIAVVGKSGSGKTTLMNLLSGIDYPTEGEILVGNNSIQRLNESQIACWRGQNIGIVFQFFQLIPTLSVIENIMLPMDFCKSFPLKKRRSRALELLNQMEIGDEADKFPTALSGGQQQRVAIARALANDPSLILADEPTGNLDSATSASVMEVFIKLSNQGKTIIMVTHDEEMAKKCSRIIHISDGQIRQGGFCHADIKMA